MWKFKDKYLNQEDEVSRGSPEDNMEDLDYFSNNTNNIVAFGCDQDES